MPSSDNPGYTGIRLTERQEKILRGIADRSSGDFLTDVALMRSIPPNWYQAADQLADKGLVVPWKWGQGRAYRHLTDAGREWIAAHPA